MALFPSDFRSSFTARCMLPTIERTKMIQAMPITIPNRDRKVRSLLVRNSCNATLKLLQMILKLRNMHRKYTFAGKWSNFGGKTPGYVHYRRSAVKDQHRSKGRRAPKHLSQRISNRIYVER